MNSRRLVALLSATALTAALFTTASPAASSMQERVAGPGSAATSTTSTARSATSPSRDFPRMPRRCATPEELIPPKPVVCKLNGFRAGRPTVLLWGDSHAWMMIPALRAAARDENLNLVATVMGSCPPMDNQVEQGEPSVACAQNNAMALDFVRKLARGDEGLRVLLNGSWQRYLHALKVKDRSSYVGQMAQRMRTDTPRLFRTLAGLGVGVDVFGQVATVPAKRASCRAGNTPYACDLPRRASLPEEASTRSWLRDVMGPLPGPPALIDVNPYFCDAQVCHGRVKDVRTWFDDLHVSATMSTKLRRYVVPTVTRATVQPPTGPQPDPDDPGCSLILFC